MILSQIPLFYCPILRYQTRCIWEWWVFSLLQACDCLELELRQEVYSLNYSWKLSYCKISFRLHRCFRGCICTTSLRLSGAELPARIWKESRQKSEMSHLCHLKSQRLVLKTLQACAFWLYLLLMVTKVTIFIFKSLASALSFPEAIWMHFQTIHNQRNPLIPHESR